MVKTLAHLTRQNIEQGLRELGLRQGDAIEVQGPATLGETTGQGGGRQDNTMA